MNKQFGPNSSWRRFFCLGLVVLPALLSGQSCLGQNATETHPGTPGQARELQVEQAKRVQGEVDQIDNELESMQSLRRQLEDAKTAMQSAPVRENITLAVGRLKAAYQELQKKSGQITSHDRALTEFRLSLSDVALRAPGAFDSALPSFSFDPGVPRELGDMRLDLLRYARNIKKPNLTTPDRIESPKLGALDEAIRSLPETQPSKWDDLKPAITDAQAEVQSLDQRVQDQWKTYKDGVVAWINSVTGSLDEEIAAKKEKQKKLTGDFEKINGSLMAQQEQAAKQGALNVMLIWAVYGMVAAIVLLFLVLRSFPSDLSQSIIKERTMIELLSMGFLLLTIIILGTGKFLGGETLGALLGTIAGYIFGRKEGERVAAQQVLQALHPVPQSVGPLPAPIEIDDLTPTAKKTVVVKFVAGTIVPTSPVKLMYRVKGVEPQMGHDRALLASDLSAGVEIGPFTTGQTIEVQTEVSGGGGAALRSQIKEVKIS